MNMKISDMQRGIELFWKMCTQDLTKFKHHRVVDIDIPSSDAVWTEDGGSMFS